MLNTKIIPVISVLAASTALLLGLAMSRPLMHDEGMYCTAGVLVAEGKLPYRDFAYVSQLPYHPLICAAVFKTFNTDHYLLAARLLSVLCDIGTVLVIFLVYLRTLSPNPRAALFFGAYAVVMYLFNTFVLYATGLAWNHDLIILCVALAFYFFTDSGLRQLWQVFLAAALLTTATFMRATTAIIWLLFLFFVLFKPGQSLSVRLKMTGLYIGVSAVFAIWPIYVILQAPAAAYLNLVVIPSLNGAYLHRIGMAFSKSELAAYAMARPDYLAILALAPGLWVYTWIRYRHEHSISMLLAVAIAITFGIIAVIPPTMWLQYFAPPVPFIIMSMAYPVARLASSQNRPKGLSYAKMLFVAAAMIAVLTNVRESVNFSNWAAWTPIRLHQRAQDIAAAAGKGNRILTLSPVIALEGGCTIYPELAAGPFAYRVADFLTPSQRELSRTIGPASIADLALKNPPKAVLVGFEPNYLEEPLRKLPAPDWPSHTFFLDDTALTLFISSPGPRVH